TFNEALVRASNATVSDPGNPNAIPLDQANSLICGGANVMNTIPLPTPPMGTRP
ncbi:MAG: hypothetical protein HYY13_06725, partial [Nitrospirae bacterium]|nr:hypothetical protein [Nitrospirota bacterium]